MWKHFRLTSLLVHYPNDSHNFGLGHSNLPSQNGLYRDRTGYMGSSDATIGKPAKCYNAYQHFQLGWFAEATITITDEGMADEEEDPNLREGIKYPGKHGKWIYSLSCGDNHLLCE